MSITFQSLTQSSISINLSAFHNDRLDGNNWKNAQYGHNNNSLQFDQYWFVGVTEYLTASVW